MNARLLERLQIVQLTDVVDANTAAQTGDYVDMARAERALFLVVMGDGTAGSDLDVAFYQSDDSSGTTTAVLNALETGRIYTKYAADFTAAQALTAWTEVTQATADEKHEPTDNGEAVGIMAYEIRAADLTDGYRYVRMDLTDPGAAKLGVSLAILELREPNSPTLTPSCTE
jgi:hypothetical protein